MVAIYGREQCISHYMLVTWTNIFRFDIPNGKVKEIWSPYTKENRQFMIFKLDDSGDVQRVMGLPGHPWQIGRINEV